MKIAKFTLNGYSNYGNVLQNYALQQILLRYAESVDTIWHTAENLCPLYWWKEKFGYGKWKNYIKFIINWHNSRSRILSGYWGMEMVRQGKIKDWCDRNIYSRHISFEALPSIGNEYDYFVVGSDQVWNPYFFQSDEELQSYFLNFAPKGKRIAYAASISVPEIPASKYNTFLNGLKGMDCISMREQAGADLVQRLTGKSVPTLVDPTLLLSSEKWDNVSRLPSWYRGQKYILTYFLGARPTNVLEKLHKDLGLEVVNLLDTSCYDYYVTGVDEFISAIKNASLVYTDSFHGTVFSILYRRPFVVCDRIPLNSRDNVGGKMNSRIDTLLHLFGLENRRGTQTNNYSIVHPLSLEYPDIDSILQQQHQRSNQFLSNALGC
ncbi:MAG: polysaccharide pyruvyl transferase family protein [Acidaminococcus sp.]|jgi:hypothetical protein|nr:polysaccharide pyruvyl transferase family protein [Acidaminococcus sp.]MCI2116460.1 polysaccharide pyruvyl transferase family protein [Acidaminococcus sp.]